MKTILAESKNAINSQLSVHMFTDGSQVLV